MMNHDGDMGSDFVPRLKSILFSFFLEAKQCQKVILKKGVRKTLFEKTGFTLVVRTKVSTTSSGLGPISTTHS
jgi:hypothetical protein